MFGKFQDKNLLPWEMQVHHFPIWPSRSSYSVDIDCTYAAAPMMEKVSAMTIPYWPQEFGSVQSHISLKPVIYSGEHKSAVSDMFILSY